MKKTAFAIAILVAIIATFTQIKTIDAQDKNPTIGINIGNKAPDLKYLNPDGKEISLYSIKNKLVLIDFWASWCGPCRKENPAVVKAYKEYKDKKFKGGKGFTIFSVSLDQNKDGWVKAIADDKLEWEFHVSDLGGWKSMPAQTYGVNSIPANFLIDKNGIILAKTLRGPALEAKLKELLAN
jgi:thiol-disulfide isomerase/thioredoxin